MLLKRISLFLPILLGLAAISFAADAAPCACCSETGAYYITTTKPEQYQLDAFKEMAFTPNAFLYMTEAGEDSIKGIENFSQIYSSESWVAEPYGFNFAGSFLNKSWKMTFKDGKGRVGTLTLPVPTTMVDFDVDIHDGESSAGGGPSLYKEWRFKGNTGGGTGFFQKGIVPSTTYFLVFQGRGNMCDNASDFTHWRLEIRGPKAEYSFFGKMKTPSGS